MSDLITADNYWLRLRGLAFRSPEWLGDRGLLFPRTRSVHTFGMRFPIDLYWLDSAGETIRIDRAVRPRRFRTCLAADAVVERRAGSGSRVGICQRLR